jgi:hypothetical protein
MDTQKITKFWRQFKALVRHKDLVLKLFSLCLGTVLWFFVVAANQVEMNIKFPIELVNLPENLVIYDQYQKELDVTVRGSRRILQELRTRNITRSIDLSDAVPDTIVIANNLDSIPLPSSVSVLRLQPANITLSIDQLVQKHIPIHAVTEGEVSLGYRLEQIVLNPSKIVVSGPKTVVDPQLALKTYVINLDGLNHSTTLPVHLNLSPELVNLIGETTVVAKILVKENFVEKTIKKIPINVKDAGVPVTVKPNSLTVKASIPESLIQETPVLSMLFRAYINAADVRLPRKLPVVVNGVTVPGHEPITILSHTPQEVQVLPVKATVTKKDVKKEVKRKPAKDAAGEDKKGVKKEGQG